MRKQKVFPIIGLIASFLIIFNNLFAFILSLLDKYSTCWNTVIAISTPALIICMFIAIRYLLVEKDTLQDFNIVVSLLIIFKSIGLVLIALPWLTHIDSKAYVYSVAVEGFLVFVFYLWFFIKLSYTSSNEVTAYSFLNYYAIAYLLLMLLAILPDLQKLLFHEDNNTLSVILQICGILPYIFISVYFYTNLKISQKSNLFTSA